MNNFQLINNTRMEPFTTRQNGAALIIGLVLLMALTILGIGAMSTTTLEQRMAGNMGDLYLAFNAAETAGQSFPGQIDPVQREPRSQNTCNDPAQSLPCIIKGLDVNWWDTAGAAYWNANGITYNGNIDDVKTQPHYIIERDSTNFDDVTIGHKSGRKRTVYYRVTSRGTGASDNAEAVVQQIIAKRYE